MRTFAWRSFAAPFLAPLRPLGSIPMAEVTTGKFGFVKLVTVDDHRVEYECFVVSQGDRWSVVMVPFAEEVGASDGSWQQSSASAAAAPAETDGPVLKVPESQTSVELKKVEAGAVRSVPQTKAVGRRVAPRPSSSVLLSLFYQSEFGRSESQSAMKASSTDDGGRSARQLEVECRRLTKEFAALKEERKGERERGSPARSPSKRGQRHYIGSVASEVDDEGVESSSDYSDDRKAVRDPIVRLIRGFRYPEDKEAGKSSVPPLPRGPGAQKGRGERSRRDGAGGRDSETARGSQERRASPAEAARHGTSPHEAAGLEIQLEIVKLLKELRDGGGVRGVAGDDAPGAQELDGLRVMRNLGRMRALREQMENEPDLIYAEYRKHWPKELGAEGRGHCVQVDRFPQAGTLEEVCVHQEDGPDALSHLGNARCRRRRPCTSTDRAVHEGTPRVQQLRVVASSLPADAHDRPVASLHSRRARGRDRSGLGVASYHRRSRGSRAEEFEEDVRAGVRGRRRGRRGRGRRGKEEEE